MSLITVIIPVYNAASYLEQCLKSVLFQSHSDIQVIAVNDGSTDESSVILDEYKKKDTRLEVIHQANRGVSVARNIGLRAAKGTYITFCDADDFMEEDMVERLYRQMVLQHAEWAICNANMIYNDGSIEKRLPLNDEAILISCDKSFFIEDMMRFKYDYANWNKLYLRSIIEENNLTFNDNSRIWEDLLFNLKYLQFVKKIVAIGQPLYNYRNFTESLYRTDPVMKIPEINKLYRGYELFINTRQSKMGFIVFREQLARILYNHFLPELFVELKGKFRSNVKLFSTYSRLLKEINPELYYYPRSFPVNLQSMKKWLLHNRLYSAYSLIVTIRESLKFL